MLNDIRFKTSLTQAIYETATDLYNDKGISDAVYEEIRQLCIEFDDKDLVEEKCFS